MSTEQTTPAGRSARLLPGDKLAEIHVLRPGGPSGAGRLRPATADQSGPPAVLSIEEAARFLRIGRTCAYEQARLYQATGGAEGLPVVRIGRILRVPRAALLRMIAVE